MHDSYDSYDNKDRDHPSERRRDSRNIASRISSFGRRKRKPTQIDFKGTDPKRSADRFVYAGLEPTQLGYENEKKFGHRMYKLKGYTTYSKVRRKYQMERNQRLLRDLLTVVMIIILIVILAIIYNPFKNAAEFSKIFGWDSKFEDPKSTVVYEESGPSETQ
ncbi:MAG: hypothetical protein GX939_08050 [Clostridiaceae bacterium]|jgi:hypothetical protein|nr:hypothetical protein [Clostridiaceae bacterium]